MADNATVPDAVGFRVLRITAHSDHPVRSAAEELIYGDHVLWDVNDPKGFIDEHGAFAGSLAPNVFGYDFRSSLAECSTLLVTIKAVDTELFGGQYVLRGLLNGHDSTAGLFESKSFSVGAEDEVTISVSLTESHTSSVPFSINGDASWMLLPATDSKKGGNEAEASGYRIAEEKTRLELYWIAKELDEVFRYICGHPALRDQTTEQENEITQQLASNLSKAYGTVAGVFRYFIPNSTAEGPVNADLHPSVAARAAFFNYSKRYDTVSGASHFGVRQTGGYFNYRYYIAARRGGGWGTLCPVVNCYDQAAMVQVTGTFRGYRPTWLFLSPYGYINPTQLVGIGRCNNPFFRSNGSPPLVAQNDQRRRAFGNHAFNGYPSNNAAAYDANCGPYLGRGNLSQYLQTAIDYRTVLYRWTRTRAGTVRDIRQYWGITRTMLAPDMEKGDEEGMSKGVQELLGRCTVQAGVESLKQSGWDANSNWVKDVFGEHCEIGHDETVLGDGIAENVWHLAGVNRQWEDARSEGACPLGSDVVMRVRIHTRVADAAGSKDGGMLTLDHDPSSRDAFLHLAAVLKDLQLDLGPDDEHISTLWSPTPLTEHAQWAVQYAPDITEGRFLLVCGNTTMDIRGGPSSGALEPYVRRLLAHTTVRAAPFDSLHIPQVIDEALEIPTPNRLEGRDGVAVKGLCTSFIVKCQMDGMVGSASADVEGHGLLLSKFEIEDDDARKRSTVLFTFVTRSVGIHVVDLRFGEARTMRMSCKKVQITVSYDV